MSDDDPADPPPAFGNNLIQDNGNGIKVNMQPPDLNKYKTYEDYKNWVDLWELGSDIPPNKKGIVLANSLPETSKRYGNNLGTALLKKHPARTLYTNDGVKIVMNFLDGMLGKTKVLSMINSFAGIDRFTRKPEQGIVEFLQEFDLRYNTCLEAGIPLPSCVVTYMLLDRADLDNTQYQLIKGVIDITQENEMDNLYEKVKEKMKDMLTDSMGKIVSELNLGPKSDEAAFCAENEQVFATWKQNKKQGWKPQASQGHFNGAKPKPFVPRDASNVKDKHGKHLKCRNCGAWNHFEQNCPSLSSNRDASSKTQKTQFRKYKTHNGKTVYLTEYQNESSSDETPEQGQISEDEDVFTVIMYTTDRQDLSRFTFEAINCGALDTCCTCTVAGKKWLNIYLDALPEDMKVKVQGPFKGGKTFLFGNEGKLKSTEVYKIPIKVAGMIHIVKVDIIASDIPLLLSKDEMKNLGMVLDMKNDAAYINGAPLKVNTTSAGHFIIDLLEQDEAFMIEEVCVVDMLKADMETQQKLLNKLHKQFGHRTKRVFVSLLKDTGNWTPHFSEMIDKIINGCEGCILRRRNPDRPVVALPRAEDFNEILTMDLKIWKGQYILYMIDLFSRFTIATVISRKKPANVIDAVFKYWITYFGTPGKVMTDNGGEFTGEEMREVTSVLNVYKDTTAAEAPWQNGLNERNHALADNILKQVMRDFPELDLKTALAWACSAKNSLTTVYGYSPYQLVYGKNPRLPNVINDQPPAWTTKPKSEVLIKHLNALHSTREAFIKAEKSEKLKIALKSKIRSIDRSYMPGEYVFYKREKDVEMRGPAKVIFQDGKIVWIRHGSYICKVSVNRLIPVQNDLAEKYKQKEAPSVATPAITADDQEQIDQYAQQEVTLETCRQTNQTTEVSRSETSHDDSENDEFEECAEENPNHADEQTAETGNTQAHETVVQNDEQETVVQENEQEMVAQNNEQQTVQDNEQQTVQDNEQQIVQDNEQLTDTQTVENNNHQQNLESPDEIDLTNQDNVVEENEIEHDAIVFKEHERVEIKDPVIIDGKWQTSNDESGVWQAVTIGKRAAKKNSKAYPNCWNFKLDSGQKFWAKIEDLEVRKMTEEHALAVYTHEHMLAVMIPRDKQNSQECNNAKMKELQKLKDFETYKVVDDVGQKYITCTWVMTQKGDEARARLTARGFQEIAEFPKDSPTISKPTLRTILSIAASKQWKITATDIKSAFLQGTNLERDVFVRPPKEAYQKGKLWKLIKCLYGLKDASRNWYDKVAKKLEKEGFKKSYYDNAIFFLIKDDKLVGMIGLHVDDFLSAGNIEFTLEVIPKVLSIFQVGKSETRTFLYTGFQIDQKKDGITLDQGDYVARMELPTLSAERMLCKEADLSENELTTYRGIVGSSNWVTRITRPDLSFDLINLSTKFKGGKIEDLKEAKKIMINIMQNKAFIKLSNVGDLSKAELWVYTDASLGNLNGGVDSTGSYILLLINPKTGKCAPLDWKSNKIKRVVGSSLSAETLSLVAGLDAAVATKWKLQDMLGKDHPFTIRALVDNKSTVQAVYSTTATPSVQEKRLLRELGGAREMLELGEVKEIKWVKGNVMLADALTKKGVNSIKLMNVMQKGELDQEFLNSVI